MLGGIIFTIGSLFFLMLLQLVYFSQDSFSELQSIAFKRLVNVEIGVVVTEIIAVIFAVYGNNMLLTNIFYKIHWEFVIFIFLMFYSYYSVYFGELKGKNLKELVMTHKSHMIVFILYFIFMILFLFIPFDVDIKENLFIPGTPFYYVLATCVLSIILEVPYFIKHSKQITKSKINIIVFMIVLLILIISAQMVFQYISFVPMGIAILIYNLYFRIENPDLINAKKLEEVKERIEKSNQAKTDFLSNMSMEIKSPMNTIVGLSEGLLNEPEFNEVETRKDLRHIGVAGRSLLEIINNILDISKIEAESETLYLKDYNLKNLVSDLSQLIKPKLVDKNVKYVVDIDPETPLKLRGDSGKLFQVMLNLLTNSVKHTDVGRVKLRIQSKMMGDNVNLTIKISDTGYGFKKDEYDELVKRMASERRLSSQEVDEMGLGLVITRNYINLMNGKITIDSEYEVGTTFTIDITQKVVGNEKIGNINDYVSEDKKLEFKDYSNKRILIVDDNKLNCKVISRILNEYKIKVDITDNGHDTINKIKSGEEYDLIFMDYLMPDMDGLELMHVLKKFDVFDVPPIICLTANALVGIKEAYLKEGFDGFISKPININELDKALNKYLNKKG